MQNDAEATNGFRNVNTAPEVTIDEFFAKQKHDNKSNAKGYTHKNIILSTTTVSNSKIRSLSNYRFKDFDVFV